MASSITKNIVQLIAPYPVCFELRNQFLSERGSCVIHFVYYMSLVCLRVNPNVVCTYAFVHCILTLFKWFIQVINKQSPGRCVLFRNYTWRTLQDFDIHHICTGLLITGMIFLTNCIYMGYYFTACEVVNFYLCFSCRTKA